MSQDTILVHLFVLSTYRLPEYGIVQLQNAWGSAEEFVYITTNKQSQKYMYFAEIFNFCSIYVHETTKH